MQHVAAIPVLASGKPDRRRWPRSLGARRRRSTARGRGSAAGRAPLTWSAWHIHPGPHGPSNSDSNPAGSGTAGQPGAAGNGKPGKSPAQVAARRHAGDWISGARLRTLPLAIAPVALGTGAASWPAAPATIHPVRARARLVVALCLQIGVNYANDYSDGIRGTDDHRVGPARLTGSGAAQAEARC